MLERRVDVHDQLDLIDVHAAGGDVGRDEHANTSGCGVGAEGCEVALAGALAEVAVQVDRRDAPGCQLAGKLLGLVLGAGEEDAAPHAGREGLDEARLVVVGDEQHAVGHGGGGHAGLVDRVAHLVAQERAHEAVDTAVEGGAEQQALSTGGRRLEDAGDARQEAEVGHVVGLVEHSDLDGVEGHDTLLHEVFESARAGDDDVDAGTHGLLLRALADATEDRGDAQTRRLRERGDGRRDLGGELAGGAEHETARTAGAAGCGLRAAEAGDEGQRERERLATAGAAAAEHVATREGVGQRVALDGEGLGAAGGLEHGDERRGHAERQERRHGGLSG
ncbi:hypothetical protein RR49_00123 [Microbacterium ginsengisoli]|uniref:Uncharacterized protein n=1 Tax=Microbacterium ginsengisoli TaxID=400772 RepID=A0A0F0LZZ5_9MICO|nr:hypothetical protein RR49_00123 [Microbacterium ginsengisoli]